MKNRFLYMIISFMMLITLASCGAPKTSTGTACRLFITVKNKLQYVNGVSAEELFDGTD